MLDREQMDKLRPNIRVLQLIIGSLIAGVLILAIVVIVIVRSVRTDAELGMMTWMGVIFAFGSLITFFAFGLASQNLGDDKKTPQTLATAYLAQTITRAALLEGAAIANLMFCFIEKHIASIIAAGILAGCMTFVWPSAEKVFAWIEARMKD